MQSKFIVPGRFIVIGNGIFDANMIECIEHIDFELIITLTNGKVYHMDDVPEADTLRIIADRLNTIESYLNDRSPFADHNLKAKGWEPITALAPSEEDEFEEEAPATKQSIIKTNENIAQEVLDFVGKQVFSQEVLPGYWGIFPKVPAGLLSVLSNNLEVKADDNGVIWVTQKTHDTLGIR